MPWIGSCQHTAFSGAFNETLAMVNPAFYSQLWTLLGRSVDKQVLLVVRSKRHKYYAASTM